MAHVLPHEVFLSHSSQDRHFVDELAGNIRRHGIPVWYSVTNILGAQQWHDEIGAALQRCDWFALVLSPQSVDSIWVKRELLYALSHNRFENKIIPIMFEPCDAENLSWTLSHFQTISFVDDVEQGYLDLLRIWGLGYRRV